MYVLTRTWLRDNKMRCKWMTSTPFFLYPGILYCAGITGGQPGWLVGKFETYLEVANMRWELDGKTLSLTNMISWGCGHIVMSLSKPDDKIGCSLVFVSSCRLYAASSIHSPRLTIHELGMYVIDSSFMLSNSLIGRTGPVQWVTVYKI